MDEERQSTPSTEDGQEYPMRADTPGPLPQHQYSREKLFDISENRGSQSRPTCLIKDYDNSDGMWDPEKWFRSIHGSRENSPLTVATGDRKRQNDDRETFTRRRSSDPRIERIKEEERDGIVLSPQRRSFGTGCHVPTAFNRTISLPAEPFKENGDRDRERRERRIGSGRIQIDRDMGRERDYRGIRDRYEREDRRSERDDRRVEREERIPEREERRTDRRTERDDRRVDRSDRRSDREDRRITTGTMYSDRNDRFERDRNNYDSRSNYKRSYSGRDGTRGHRKMHHEEEPEWFTSGPTSQTDTIELCGFEKEESNHGEDEYEEERSAVQKPVKTETKDTNAATISVTDRNGSLETNESSSPENSPMEPETRFSPTSQFDFNQFFNVNNIPIPGLADDSAVEKEAPSTGSRFSQWFINQAGHVASQENSRRSSLNEEFGYLNDILEGSKSPVVPSPPPGQLYEKNMFCTPFMIDPKDGIDPSVIQQQKGNPNQVMQALFMNNMSPMDKPNTLMNSNNFSTHDAEAQLKALLFSGKKDSASSSGTASPASMSVGKLQHFHSGVARRAKTLAELEAGFHGDSPLVSLNNSVHRMMSPAQLPSLPQESKQEEDLTAFNKLLSMMTAGAAAAVAQDQQPKTPNSMPQIARSLSPQLSQLMSNNDFMQALIRNKEQQLQIQQHTLQNMRYPPQTQQQTPTIPSTSQQSFAHSSPANLGTHRIITQDPILSFIQQNPTIITKPPSPAPNIPAHVQNTSTPRVISPLQMIPPNMMPSQVQHAQNHRTKISSPIMFSQQPPMHLNAPSPIHPSQLSRSLANRSISPHAQHLITPAAIHPQTARIPSPQELIAHTQVIMQNALIKKQLEDQKERFLKKQQERCRSPNQMMQQKYVSGSETPTMTGQMKPTMSVAFTPTSVIRRMHSDRVIEKEKKDSDSNHNSPVQCPPIKQLVKNDNYGNVNGDEDGADRSEGGDERKLDNSEMMSQQDHEIMSLPGINFSNDPEQVMMHIEDKMKNSGISGQMNTSTQGGMNKPMPILGSISKDKGMRPLVGQRPMQSSMPPQNNVPNTMPPMFSTAPIVPGRPIVKDSGNPNVQGGMPTMLTGMTNMVPVSMSSPGTPRTLAGMSASSPLVRSDGQRAIVGTSCSVGNDMSKLLEQQRLQQQQQQQVRQVQNTPMGRPMSTAVTTPSFGVPITGRLPVQSNLPPPLPPPPVHPVAANALIMQQMMQRNLTPSAASVNAINQMNQINQLNHLVALQAQQRMVDPRLQGARFPPVVSPMLSPRSSVANNIGLGAGGNPAINAVLSRAISPHVLPGQKLNLNGPLSPNMQSTPISSMSGNKGMGDPHILKWFSPEVLKNQLPTMPPLPVQGQKVLTLDELEGARQALTN